MEPRRLLVMVAMAMSGLCTSCSGDDAPAQGTGSSTGSSTGGTTVVDDTTAPGSSSSSSTTGPQSDTTAELPLERWVRVTLDGAPLEGASVIQGGTNEVWLTGKDGRVLVTVDTEIQGELVLMAAYATARTEGQLVLPDDTSEVELELETFGPDNEAYSFDPPGVPDDPGSTAECGHCHRQLKAQWYGSVHRSSADNTVVQDVYAGVASAFDDQTTCENQGGQWWDGLVPGTESLAPRCYLGAGTLPDLNPGCGDAMACDTVATSFGACADCHAPAIDGVLGGRDLLEATGTSFDSGVHCDLCHKVESIDPMGAAGVAGWLRIVRPSEESASPAFGRFRPLSFGPYIDVPNPRMGSVAREHFASAELCAGCHQLDQAALVPGTSLDPARWPDGVFPAHSTYAEWAAGPFFGTAPCSSCHMPADPEALNGADLEPDQLSMQGFARGWVRPPGAVRQHTFIGPRTPESSLLQLAAAVFIESAVEGDVLTTQVTVRNVGAGHAIPTGEPLRSLVLFVRARCGDQPLVAIDGDAIPELGGWLDRKASGEDWLQWPGAQVGDVVRVVDDPGTWHDYPGFGPFGDGTFDAAAKGLPMLRVVGQSTVVMVDGDQVTFDAPLPAGDLALRGRPDAFDGDPTAAVAVAGAPGFAFARVLADADGARMVPHHRAVDVVSDNRILPQQEWTSTHVFGGSCPEPVVDAMLVHRPYPVGLVRERGWDGTQQVMVEVSQ